jgi:NAD(P)-dependent dehydrogenase (short-subunit alcohol dehydrogenase family)
VTDGLDPDELAIALRVLKESEELDPEHPDVLALRRATARHFKFVKKARKDAKRDEVSEADKAVVARTATGSPQRIDDETDGIPLVSSAKGAIAGHYQRARPCYICKQDYTQVDAFYHQLCPSCAAISHAKREQRTDLTGRRALLTGGRAKIGMYIALRLLRDGAHTTITTRFPNDAVRRFGALPDSAEWIHRLKIVGIDLRDPAQVVALADSVAADGPLDILINNATQTVRRTAGAYAPLVAAEHEPLPQLTVMPEVVTFDHISEARPAALAGSLSEHPPPRARGILPAAGVPKPHLPDTLQGADISRMSLFAGNASLERHLDNTAIDAGGLLPDVLTDNTWTNGVSEVDPLELLEVILCNQTAPFILVSRLRPSLKASTARRKYIVNVSAMEGVFGRGYKGKGHPHTNMAKAAVNMLTRTSSGELFEDGILMTSVDTGWITDERPHFTKLRLAEEGFHAPLDLVDGAARVYDPIVQGELGNDLYGVFLKDYERSQW